MALLGETAILATQQYRVKHTYLLEFIIASDL